MGEAVDRVLALARQHVSGYTREGVAVRPYWRSVRHMLTVDLLAEADTISRSEVGTPESRANRLRAIKTELRLRTKKTARAPEIVAKKSVPKSRKKTAAKEVQVPTPPPGQAKFRDTPEFYHWGVADADTKARVQAAIKDMELAWPHTAPKAVLVGPSTHESLANTRFGPNEAYLQLEQAAANLTPFKIQKFKDMEKIGGIAHGSSEDVARYSVYHEWGHNLDGLVTGITSSMVFNKQLTPEQEALYEELHHRIGQALLDAYPDRVPFEVMAFLAIQGALKQGLGSQPFRVAKGHGVQVSSTLLPLINGDLSAYATQSHEELIAEGVAGYMTNGPGDSVVADTIVNFLSQQYEKKFGAAPPLLSALPHPVTPKPRLFKKWTVPDAPDRTPIPPPVWKPEDENFYTEGTFRGLHVQLYDLEKAEISSGFSWAIYDDEDKPLAHGQAEDRQSAIEELIDAVDAYYSVLGIPDQTEQLTFVHTDLGDESEFAGYPLRVWKNDDGTFGWSFLDPDKGHSQSGVEKRRDDAIKGVKSAIATYQTMKIQERGAHQLAATVDQANRLNKPEWQPSLANDNYYKVGYDFAKKAFVDLTPEERIATVQGWEADRNKSLYGSSTYNTMTGALAYAHEQEHRVALKPVTYKEVPRTEWEYGTVGFQIGPTHEIQAFDGNGKKIGHLTWQDDTGEILDIRVHGTRTRQGIATEMLRRAREINPKVHHSKVLTSEGEAFAHAVPWRFSPAEAEAPDISDMIEQETRGPDHVWQAERVDLEPYKTLTPEQRAPAVAAREANPNFNTLGGDYKGNCYNAVAAWDERMRGYDVTALPAYSDPESGSSTVCLTEWVPRWRSPQGMRVEHLDRTKPVPDAVFAQVSGFKMGNYGLLWILWKHGNAHVIAWVNSPDGPHIYDPQRGVEILPDDHIWREIIDAQFIRTDNAEPDGTGVLLPESEGVS